eukprot:GHVN01096786.1.p1 GENE.GHVN01096786.1~~GHVN01096786.1.p1  ORF type:complete len:1294 (+),score=290.61 GHVN01096786.1:30-3911(+)
MMDRRQSYHGGEDGGRHGGGYGQRGGSGHRGSYHRDRRPQPEISPAERLADDERNLRKSIITVGDRYEKVLDELYGMSDALENDIREPKDATDDAGKELRSRNRTLIANTIVDCITHLPVKISMFTSLMALWHSSRSGRTDYARLFDLIISKLGPKMQRTLAFHRHSETKNILRFYAQLMECGCAEPSDFFGLMGAIQTLSFQLEERSQSAGDLIMGVVLGVLPWLSESCIDSHKEFIYAIVNNAESYMKRRKATWKPGVRPIRKLPSQALRDAAGKIGSEDVDEEDHYADNPMQDEGSSSRIDEEVVEERRVRLFDRLDGLWDGLKPLVDRLRYVAPDMAMDASTTSPDQQTIGDGPQAPRWRCRPAIRVYSSRAVEEELQKNRKSGKPNAYRFRIPASVVEIDMVEPNVKDEEEPDLTYPKDKNSETAIPSSANSTMEETADPVANSSEPSARPSESDTTTSLTPGASAYVIKKDTSVQTRVELPDRKLIVTPRWSNPRRQIRMAVKKESRSFPTPPFPLSLPVELEVVRGPNSKEPLSPIEIWALEEVVVNIIDSFSTDVSKCAIEVLKIPLPFLEVESVLISTIFTEMLCLPSPRYLPVFYFQLLHRISKFQTSTVRIITAYMNSLLEDVASWDLCVFDRMAEFSSYWLSIPDNLTGEGEMFDVVALPPQEVAIDGDALKSDKSDNGSEKSKKSKRKSRKRQPLTRMEGKRFSRHCLAKLQRLCWRQTLLDKLPTHLIKQLPLPPECNAHPHYRRALHVLPLCETLKQAETERRGEEMTADGTETEVKYEDEPPPQRGDKEMEVEVLQKLMRYSYETDEERDRAVNRLHQFVCHMIGQHHINCSAPPPHQFYMFPTVKPEEDDDQSRSTKRRRKVVVEGSARRVVVEGSAPQTTDTEGDVAMDTDVADAQGDTSVPASSDAPIDAPPDVPIDAPLDVPADTRGEQSSTRPVALDDAMADVSAIESEQSNTPLFDESYLEYDRDSERWRHDEVVALLAQAMMLQGEKSISHMQRILEYYGPVLFEKLLPSNMPAATVVRGVKPRPAERVNGVLMKREDDDESPEHIDEMPVMGLLSEDLFLPFVTGVLYYCWEHYETRCFTTFKKLMKSDNRKIPPEVVAVFIAEHLPVNKLNSSTACWELLTLALDQVIFTHEQEKAEIEKVEDTTEEVAHSSSRSLIKPDPDSEAPVSPPAAAKRTPKSADPSEVIENVLRHLVLRGEAIQDDVALLGVKWYLARRVLQLGRLYRSFIKVESMNLHLIEGLSAEMQSCLRPIKANDYADIVLSTEKST